MIKGAQKQMIVVRTGESPYFDEAYFVLRRDICPKRQERTDILSEADRILRESGGCGMRAKRRGNRALPWSLLAFFCGVAVGFIIRFLL